MGKQTTNQTMYLIILLLAVSTVSAMTIDELIESFNYDFSDGTIEIIAFDDYMYDADSDNINDTLVINLTVDALNASNYYFIVNLDEGFDLIHNYSNITVNNTQNAIIKFDTKNLQLNQYNYSVEIRGMDYSLLYMKYKTETNLYTNYEKGVEIYSISDQNINNDSIRITLNLNVTDNQTANVTVFMTYNDTSTSATKEVALTTPTHVVNVDFDNETIKSTHHSGVFIVDSVMVGNKLLDTDYNTSSYDFEDFAKTSYIVSITSGSFDNNSNNLSEALEFNFTINAKTASTYTLEAAIYDMEDNYIMILAKNQSLSVGANIISIEVSGEEIYKTYYYGEFVLPVVTLAIGNVTKDVIYDAHTTNTTYYSDYEKPPLPDLYPTINVTLTGNNANIYINISNVGERPAYNIGIDIFNNESFSNASTITYLGVNDSVLFEYTASNIDSDTTFIAVVDFNNFVDEENESNNIAVINVTSNYTAPTGTGLLIKDTSGSTIAIFEYSGDISLSGTIEQSSTHSRTSNDEWIIRNNGEDIFILDTETGNLYIDGTIAQNQSSITPNSDNDFIIKDSQGTAVILVDESGYMFIKGEIKENQ